MSTGDQGSRLLSEQVSPVLGYRNGSRRCRVHITGRSDWNPWSRRRRIAEWEWRETIRFHLIHPIVSFTGSLLYEASSGSSASAVGLVSNADGTNGTARNVARHVATRWTCVCGSAVACANAGATSIQRWPSTEVDRTVETIEQGSLESSHPRATAFAAEMAGVRWCTIGVVELLAALSAASLSSLPSLGGMVGVSTTSSPSIPTSVSFTASRCMSASSATAAACWVIVLGLALAEVCLASLLPFVLLWFCFLLFLVLLLFVLAFAAASSSSPSSDALRPRDRERECCVARARPRPRCLELARLTSSDGLYSLSDVPSLHGTGCAVFLAFVRVVALARVMLVRSSPSVLVLLSSSLAAAAAARCWALVRTVGRSLVALSGS